MRRLSQIAVVTLAAMTGACAAQTPASKPSDADIESLQKEIISKLAGDSEIRSGVKLADRNTPANREEARVFLVDLLRRFGLEPKQQAYSAQGTNVYAVLSCGKSGAETVVLGAHYDTVPNSPGANDDASGVATVAAVARQMTGLSKRSRDIIFAFFDEEERGLRGSRAFAQMLKDQNRLIHSVHTIDQMGWDQNHNRAIELELPYEGAREPYEKAAQDLKISIPIFITGEAGSDHSAFRKQGYKAVGITEEYRHGDTTPWMHKPGDKTDTIDFGYLRSTTQLLAEVMTDLTR
jgi:hypothetical protein